ncbi:MAG TPA: UPF0262 family protein [Alphaproteobacteria bacterium]
MSALNIQNYIHKIELDEKTVIRRSAVVEAERASAIRDILHKNTFRMLNNDRGPYYVRIGASGNQLHFQVRDCLRNELPVITLPLSPFRRLIKDYFLICESFALAHSGHDRMRLQTIDMARRGLHNEGAEILRERLSDVAEMDFDTARCLFTLICVLQIGVSHRAVAHE